jgi:hypothetical protein
VKKDGEFWEQGNLEGSLEHDLGNNEKWIEEILKVTKVDVITSNHHWDCPEREGRQRLGYISTLPYDEEYKRKRKIYK